MLCLTLNGNTMAENRKLYSEKMQYADLVELRLDYLKPENEMEFEDAKRFPSEIDKPVILTCRRSKDGGLYCGEEKQRLNLLKKVSQGNFSYVDLEKDIDAPDFEKNLKQRNVKIIKSVHCSDSMPEDIEKIWNELAVNGNIPKLAVKINSVSDLLELFKFSEKTKDLPEKIIVGMGKYGIPARILYKKLGSEFMFCGSEEIASGILSIEKMKALYHADKVGKETEIFGLAGNPVLHSCSPKIHNNGFYMAGLDSVYVPFPTDDISAFFKFAEFLNISGFSVTAPFKRSVIPFLDKTDQSVKKIGACNTVINSNGCWKGFNTDSIGFSRILLDEKNIKSALIIGAGAVAETLVSELVARKIKTTIVNRTIEKASMLAKKYSCDYDSLENIGNYSNKADLIIQSTSSSVLKIKDFMFSGRETVCDLVYNPVKTDFLKTAEEKGCKIITGLDFLFAQAVPQFEIFTGKSIPEFPL